MGGLTNNNTIYEIHDFENNQSPAISAEVLDTMELGIKEAVENRAQNIISTNISLFPQFWEYNDILSMFVYDVSQDAQFSQLQNKLKNNIYIDILINNNVENSMPSLMFYLKAWFDINKTLCFGLKNLDTVPTEILNIKLIIYNNILTNENYAHINTSSVRDDIILDPLDSIFLTMNKKEVGKKDAYNWEISTINGEQRTLALNEVSKNSFIYPTSGNEPQLKFKALTYQNINGLSKNSMQFGPNNTLVYYSGSNQTLYFWRPSQTNNEIYERIDLSAYIFNEDIMSLNLQEYGTANSYGKYSFVITKNDKPCYNSSKIFFLNEKEFIIAVNTIKECNIQPYNTGSTTTNNNYRKIKKLIFQNIFYIFDCDKLISRQDNFCTSFKTYPIEFPSKDQIASDSVTNNSLNISIGWDVGCCQRNEKKFFFVKHSSLSLGGGSKTISSSLRKLYILGEQEQTLVDEIEGLDDYTQIYQAKNYCIVYDRFFETYDKDSVKQYIYYLNLNNKLETNTLYINDVNLYYDEPDLMQDNLFSQSPYLDSNNNMYFLFYGNWSPEWGYIKKINNNGAHVSSYSSIPLDLIPISNDRFFSKSKKYIYDSNLIPYLIVDYNTTNFINPAENQTDYVFLQQKLQDNITINKNEIFYSANIIDKNNIGIDKTALTDLSAKITLVQTYIDTYNLSTTSQTFFSRENQVKYNPTLSLGFNQSYNCGFAKNNLFFDQSGNGIHFITENFDSQIFLPTLMPVKDSHNNNIAYYWIKVRED